jgi:hypothetical protein
MPCSLFSMTLWRRKGGEKCTSTITDVRTSVNVTMCPQYNNNMIIKTK